MQLKTGKQVIEALGGPYAVAAIYAEDVRVVFNWMRRGLPPNTREVLGEALRLRRLEYDPYLAFKQRRRASTIEQSNWRPYQPGREGG